MGEITVTLLNPITRLVRRLPERLRDARWDVVRGPSGGDAEVRFVTSTGNYGTIDVTVDASFPTDELVAQLTMVLA